MLTATDNITELDISELVDMESEPACEHSGHPTGKWHHQGPAWAIIRRWFKCGCSPNDTILICESAYKGARFLHCTICGDVVPRDEGWQLVSIL